MHSFCAPYLSCLIFQNDKVNPAESTYAKWTRCHLSGEPLAVPVCVDELGNVYNKDAM